MPRWRGVRFRAGKNVARFRLVVGARSANIWEDIMNTRRIATMAVLALAAFTMGAVPAKAVEFPCSTAKLIVP